MFRQANKTHFPRCRRNLTTASKTLQLFVFFLFKSNRISKIRWTCAVKILRRSHKKTIETLVKVISARSTWYVRKLFIMVRQNEDQIVLVSRNVTVLGQVCKNVTEALKQERESDCQKAVQEISNFLVQAWTHAQDLPKKPTD